MRKLLFYFSTIALSILLAVSIISYEGLVVKADSAETVTSEEAEEVNDKKAAMVRVAQMNSADLSETENDVFIIEDEQSALASSIEMSKNNSFGKSTFFVIFCLVVTFLFFFLINTVAKRNRIL